MTEFEQLLSLFFVAVSLAAVARRLGAPYPVFLAIGGVFLAFLPGAPSIAVPPELTLALFVAPVILDAAYDTSLRDLKYDWAPITGLVVFAVGFTTAAVAVVAHMLIPSMPWAAAITLGAVVAPPDAVAATAVLRQLRPPQRLLTILEGESLLNDASALMIYRLAVGAAASHFSVTTVAPTFFVAVVGSLIVGPTLGWLVLRLMDRVRHVPTSIILQFVTTFAVWIFAERIGLSGVLTTVCYAIMLGRSGPARIPAQMRIPSYAVWDTVVFALNILAFIFIGLQMRPILESLEPANRVSYCAVAGAVLLTVMVMRFAWHMPFNAVVRWRHRRSGFHPLRPMLRPTFGSGLVISWAGMRGIVTLAAAMALPPAFPYRDLIVLTAFLVVLGTLVIQGLTLKPVIRALNLHDGDPVGSEVIAARVHTLRAALASLDDDTSSVAEVVRQELKVRLQNERRDAEEGQITRSAHSEVYRRALAAARRAVLLMRSSGEIGDDAFHRIEEELDWLEMTGVGDEE